MKNYFVLTKTLILCGFDITNSKGKIAINRNLTTFISIAATVGFVCWITHMFVGVIESQIAAGGTGYGFVEQGMAAGMLVALVMGIPLVLTAFYVSSDTTTLLSLPVSLTTIAAARFTRCFIYAYSMVFLFCLPTFIAFGLASHAPALYWIIAIITFLAIPAVPLAYDAIAAMVLMRIFRKMRNKRVLTGIGSVVSALFVIVWVYFAMGSNSSDTMGMAASLSALNGIGVIFPNLVFANCAFEQLSLLHLLLFIATSAGFVAVFLVVAKFIYYDSVIGMSEMAARHQALTKKDTAGLQQTHSSQSAYTRIERQKIRRNSLLVQTYFYELIWPVMIIGTGVYSAMRNSSDNMLSSLSEMPGNENVLFILAVFTLAMSCLCSASNTVSAMEISLEGNGLIFLKSLPISFRDIVVGKIRSGLPVDYLVGNIAPLAATIYCIANGTTPLALPIVIATGLAGSIAVNYIQIMFDLNKPQLNWSDQSALARKGSTMFSVLASMALGMALCLISVLAWTLLGLGVLPATGICLALSIGSAIAIRSAALNYGDRRLRELP